MFLAAVSFWADLVMNPGGGGFFARLFHLEAAFNSLCLAAYDLLILAAAAVAALRRAAAL
jgi:hypothetical protein